MPAPTRKSTAVKTRGGPVAPVMIKGDGASKKSTTTAAAASAAASVASKKGKGQSKSKVVPVAQEEEEDEDEDDDEMDEDFEDEDSEDEEMEEDEEDDDDASISDASDASAEGTSERGLKRLIEALGEDGLDEDELAELAALQDGEDSEEEGEDEELEEEDEDEDAAVPTNGSGSKDTLAASLARSGLIPQAVDDDDDEEDEEDEEDEDEDPDASAIPLDSLDDAAYASLPDAVRSSRFHREKINNRPALTAVRDLIALDGPSTSASGSSQKKMDWIEHMSLSWDHSVASELEEQGAAADDDLKRELIFYKQALSAAQLGRQKVLAAGMPFSRPDDFFAEMVKSDSHMERVRQTLLDERAGIKASEEAKRQRELKKFGKKVQVQKGLERQKNKKEMEEKIEGLKRKRGGVATAGDDDVDDAFDIRIENALQSAASSSSSSARGGRGRGRGRGAGGGGGAKMPRTARDDKFGFGGKKRFSKSNTRESTEAGYGKYEGAGRGGGGGRGGRGGARGARGGRGGGGRGGSTRLGKSKRK